MGQRSHRLTDRELNSVDKRQSARGPVDAAVDRRSDLAACRDRVEHYLGNLRAALSVDDGLCSREDGVAVPAANQIAGHRDGVAGVVSERLSADADVDDAAPRREPRIPDETRPGELKEAAAHAVRLGEAVLEGS